MAIPALTDEGFLPAGLHDCTLAEVEERFGQFQRTDRRPRLFERLAAFVAQATATGLIEAIIVDGSFVTANEEPNDIDLIVVLRADHDFRATLRPFEYNVVSRQDVRRLFRLDILVASSGERDLQEHIDFFSRVRESPTLHKGMLRVSI